MRATYAHIELVISEHARPDRAPRMPLLGPFSGAIVALLLWSGIAWLTWAVVGS